MKLKVWCPSPKYLMDFEVRLLVYLFELDKEFPTMAKPLEANLMT